MQGNDAIIMTGKRYSDETIDYRRGFVEGQSCERDAYLLLTGCNSLDEYDRGFADGLATQDECSDHDSNPTD